MERSGWDRQVPGRDTGERGRITFQFGQTLKASRRRSLVQEVFGQYMKDNYFTKANLDQSSFSLNMAACQLVLDICS